MIYSYVYHLDLVGKYIKVSISQLSHGGKSFSYNKRGKKRTKGIQVIILRKLNLPYIQSDLSRVIKQLGNIIIFEKVVIQKTLFYYQSLSVVIFLNHLSFHFHRQKPKTSKVLPSRLLSPKLVLKLTGFGKYFCPVQIKSMDSKRSLPMAVSCRFFYQENISTSYYLNQFSCKPEG